MDRYKLFEEKLKNREKIVGPAISNMLSTIMVEKIADSLDFVLFDGEHGIYNNESLVECLQVARLKGVPSFIRVADAEYHLISRALYMGADGIMIPRTETLQQLRTAIDGLLFAPDGRKGMGGCGQFRPGEKFADFKKTRFLLPQIESPEGIKNLPAMLEEYGEYISAVIIGPYDMSVMVGTPANIGSDEMNKAVQEVFDICKKYNKSCGIFCDNEILAKKYRDMGANVLWMAVDRDYYMRGLNVMLDGVKEL